jgi:hypothetical protein
LEYLYGLENRYPKYLCSYLAILNEHGTAAIKPQIRNEAQYMIWVLYLLRLRKEQNFDMGEYGQEGCKI